MNHKTHCLLFLCFLACCAYSAEPVVKNLQDNIEQIKSRFGLIKLAFFNGVFKTMSTIDSQATFDYEYKTLGSDLLIINHKEFLSNEDIARQVCRSDDHWTLSRTKLSAPGRTVLNVGQSSAALQRVDRELWLEWAHDPDSFFAACSTWHKVKIEKKD